MAYSAGDIKVYPFDKMVVTGLKIEKKIGEHARAVIRGDITAEDSERYPYISEDEVVTVKFGGEPYFCGYVEKIRVNHVAQNHYLEVVLVSLSIDMDVCKMVKSFQNKKTKYADMLKEIAKNSNLEIIVDKEIKDEIKKPIIQYFETDWEFIKRMASRMEKEIVFDSITNTIYAGKCERISHKVANPVYKVEKDIQKFRELSRNGKDSVTSNDYMAYRLESREIFEVGEKAEFNGKEFEIRECTIELLSGDIMAYYRLTVPGKNSVMRIKNKKIAGKSFNCEVLKCIGNRVKVKLTDLNDEITEADAYEFPFATPYSAQGNTGMYIMPEEKDNVLLTFPTDEEVDAIVTASVRVVKEGDKKKENDRHNDPEVKYIRTKNGKEIMLDKESIRISALDAKIYIKLTEKEGIKIFSEKDVVIQSDGNMNISSKGKMNLESKQGITLISKGAVTNLTQSGYEVKSSVNKSN